MGGGGGKGWVLNNGKEKPDMSALVSGNCSESKSLLTMSSVRSLLHNVSCSQGSLMASEKTTRFATDDAR